MRATPASPNQSYDGAWLRRQLDQHKMGPIQLAILLGCSVHVIHAYMCDQTSKRWRRIPERRIRQIQEILK